MNAKLHFWSVAPLFVVAFLITFSRADEREQPKMLLKAVDMTTAELTPKQSKILNRIQNARWTVGKVKVVSADADVSALLKVPLTLPLPGQDKELIINDYKILPDSNTGATVLTCKWAGSSVKLTRTDGDWDGLIYAHNHVYSLESLGEGLHAISRVDQSQLPDERPK